MSVQSCHNFGLCIILMASGCDFETIPFPYDITAVDHDTNSELLKYFTGERTGFVQVGPEKYFFPSKYRDLASQFYNFQARSDDIWVVTFPRSGTTWTQELVWLVDNNCNFDAARRVPLTERFPFFEFSVFMHDEVKSELLAENCEDPEKQKFIEMISVPLLQSLNQKQGTRYIKSHLPFSLLPPSVMHRRARVIYVARNPKDVAVSYYYLNKLYRTQGYIGDFPRYWYYFQKGLNPWMPYWSHIKEAIAQKEQPNVLFMLYEDMKKHLPTAVEKVATFLNKKLTPLQVTQLSTHLNIDSFKKNPAVNGHEMQEVKILNSNAGNFVRNGIIGGWQNEFPIGLTVEANSWIEENCKNSNLHLYMANT